MHKRNDLWSIICYLLEACGTLYECVAGAFNISLRLPILVCLFLL